MKILHTSDWHLGASINKRERREDFEFALEHILKIIREQNIGALIISGDIYDTYTPPNWAQEMFYTFLCDAQEAGVREVIVTSGNHDNSRELSAPGPLVSRLKYYLIGQKTAEEDIDRVIIPLGEDAHPEAVVCAVPFMRVLDIPTQEEESSEIELNPQREERFRRGLQKHYERLCARARERFPNVPIIAMGHFTAIGGKISDAYEIGGLENISLEGLPAEIDYFAMGHFHRPQKIRGSKNAYYSGSLIQTDFGDSDEDNAADSDKSVYILDTDDISAEPTKIPIPQKRKFITIRGTADEIEKKVDQVAQTGEYCYLRVINTGDYCGHLTESIRRRIDEIRAANKDRVIVVSAENEKINPIVGYQRRNLDENGKPLSLEKLEPMTVFQRLLAEKQKTEPGRYTEEKRKKLLAMFEEVYNSYKEN